MPISSEWDSSRTEKEMCRETEPIKSMLGCSATASMSRAGCMIFDKEMH